MRIAAYELANKLIEKQGGYSMGEIAKMSGVSEASLDALLRDSTISQGNLIRLTRWLGVPAASYFEYVSFDAKEEGLINQMKTYGFESCEGGVIAWKRKDGARVTVIVTQIPDERMNDYKEVKYGVMVRGDVGRSAGVAFDVTLHEACNIAYLQASVLGWEAK